MSKAKKTIWFNPDADYMGATGCDTVREMAELVLANPDLTDMLFAFEEETDLTVDRIEAELFALDVHAVTLSAGHMRQEVWDQSKVYACAVGDKPGRGYVKVLGVSL